MSRLNDFVDFWLRSAKLCLLILLGVGLLQLSLYPIIQGKVVDNKDIPLEEVRISLEGEQLIEEKVTGEDGAFSFSVNKSDIYFVNFSKLGYNSKTVTIDLAQGETREISVVLERLKTLSDYQVQNQSLATGSEREGIASTRINEDAVINQRIVKADDLSGVSANLYNLSSGSSFTSMFTLRGISSVNTIDPLVGMYIDGVAQFQSYNYPINLGNISSIEILKGPQITLYGRNAMAGMIDIRTKIPPNRFSVALSGEWFSGSYNRFGGQAYDLSFSIPLKKDVAYLKTGGYVLHRPGIFYNETLGKFTDRALNFNVFLRSDVFLSDFDFFIQAKYERIREGAFPYNQDREEALSRPYFVNHNFENISHKDIGDVAFNFKVPLRYFDISSVWYYQYLKGRLEVDTDFGSSDSFIKLNLDQHLVTEETKLTSTEDSSKYVTWLVGNYFYVQKRDVVSESELGIGAVINTELDIKEVNLGLAVFGSVTYPILDNLHLIGGIRFDYDYKNVSVDKTDTSNLTGAVSTDPKREEKKHYFFWSPKLALNFYIDELNLLFLSGSRGFRVGGLNTFTSQPNRLLYEPENTWNAEFGVKSRFVPEYKGTLQTSVFYIYWNDPQVNVFLPTAQNVFEFGIINATSAHSVGVELELDLPIYWGFSVGGAYGFSRSVFLDFTTINGEQVKGKFQPYVPQHTIATFLQHQFDFELLSKRDAVINRFDFKYISKVFYNPENNLEQDGYYLLNYTFNFRINGIIATFWIKNIIDTRYFDFAIPFGNRLTPKWGEPRTFGGKISFIF